MSLSFTKYQIFVTQRTKSHDCVVHSLNRRTHQLQVLFVAMISCIVNSTVTL